MTVTQREKKLASALRAVIILVVAVVLITASCLGAVWFVRQSTARTVLYRAKLTRLSAWSVSAERYGKAQPFSDHTGEGGFAGGVLDQVRELSGCEGAVRLLRTGESGYEIQELAYTENGFTAVYRAQGENGSWQVCESSVWITS